MLCQREVGKELPVCLPDQVLADVNLRQYGRSMSLRCHILPGAYRSSSTLCNSM